MNCRQLVPSSRQLQPLFNRIGRFCVYSVSVSVSVSTWVAVSMSTSMSTSMSASVFSASSSVSAGMCACTTMWWYACVCVCAHACKHRATIKPNTSPTTRNHPQLQSRPLQNLALKSAIVLHCFRALSATLAIMKVCTFLQYKQTHVPISSVCYSQQILLYLYIYI